MRKEENSYGKQQRRGNRFKKLGDDFNFFFHLKFYFFKKHGLSNFYKQEI